MPTAGQSYTGGTCGLAPAAATGEVGRMRAEAFAGAPWVVAVMFAMIGALHLAVPRFFEQIMPRWVPASGPLGRRSLVVVSGAFEILGALGVLYAPTRARAGWGLILLLLAVFPANIHMLLDARRRRSAAWWQALLWARLPIQPLIMLWVYSAAVRGGAAGA